MVIHQEHHPAWESCLGPADDQPKTIWRICGAVRQGDVAARSAYCRYVIVAAAIGAVVLLIAAGLAWTAYLVHVGNLDAMELAGKVATPDPVSALDWPELHVRAIVPQPGEQPLVLLLVDWPAHPQRAATLLVALDGDERSVPLLSQWCATQASVSPTRQGGADLELRRRQSLERVHAVLLAEDHAR